MGFWPVLRRLLTETVEPDGALGNGAELPHLHQGRIRSMREEDLVSVLRDEKQESC